MLWSLLFTLQALCASVAHAMQHYPAAWGHYDVCKSQIYTEEGLAWDYMACQPEATDMTKYLRVALDPPNITCGDPPETYCALENPYMCNNECDATTEELAHPPELMFDFEGRNPTTFWQSTSWKKYPKPLQVNLTLSWNKTIELTDDIVLTFESGRPEQMVLEKSLDYGRTWTPYQFYATDCLDAFTMEPKTVNDLTQRTLLDIICTEDYSRGYVWKNDKTVRFEIKDRFALFAGPRLHNMASLYGQLDTTKNLRDFFTITDLRIRLLKPATGATMVDENNLSRYFYAISDIKVQGRCKCNLHANSCVFDKGKLGCECEHNTTGPDCSRCKRHYHGRAWSVGSYLPIPKGTANICKCKCNLHANSCVFDKGKLGCECEHNTTGPDCSRCKRHYHGRAWSVGSYLPIPKGTANICNLCPVNLLVDVLCRPITQCSINHPPPNPFSCLPTPPPPPPPYSLPFFALSSTARVCDNAMLRCQNGGTCHHHQRCHCSPGFTGVLCERARCQGPGECDDQLSGRAFFHHPPPIGRQLALFLILILIVSLC
uniref:Vav 3 guanine nucleotide exchange factor b n=1 Tax=Sphaeramia orbicularis TaxID=375764 RepID=A0A672Z0G9_9TELE